MQFGMLQHVRLNEDGALAGIEAGAEIVQDNFQSVFGETRGLVIVGGERMPIRDKEKTLVSLLQPNPALERSDVVPQMQLAGGTHAAENARTGMGGLIGH